MREEREGENVEGRESKRGGGEEDTQTRDGRKRGDKGGLFCSVVPSCFELCLKQ